MTHADALYNIKFEPATFVAQLVGFAVIIFVVVRYFVPPIRRMMTRRQDQVRTQMAESKQASARLAEARQAHDKAIDDARRQSVQIRADAGADAEQIAAQLREQADAEVARVRQRGRDQVTWARQQLIRELKADLGTAALTQAERQVRDQLATPQGRSDSVDRFLDELEAMAATVAVPAGPRKEI